MIELIGQRLKFAREQAKLTQADVAKRLGFNDRQTLTAIEAGRRKLTAEELVKATKVFGVDLDFLTDPLRLVGEGKFTWTVKDNAGAAQLDRLEALAGGWVALYRAMGAVMPDTPSRVLEQRLPLKDRGSLEEVQAAAEALAEEWRLEDTPARILQAILEKELGYLILNFNEGGYGISGACRLPHCNAIFLDRSSYPGERSIDLAIQCFHLLTWESLTPGHCVNAGEHLRGNGQEKHIARLAKRFAEVLLVPAAPLSACWGARGRESLQAFITKTAAHFQVTQMALRTRLVDIGLTSADQLPRIAPGRLTDPNRARSGPLPPVFSRSFIERLYVGLSQGHLGVRRAADVLGVSVQGLAELFATAELPVPFTL